MDTEESNNNTATISRAASGLSSSSTTNVPEMNPGERKQKWKEPTRAAVNMSLRAEKESKGGRRRLASDLYKIMMADTDEAGFSLEPCDEDSMDKWCIKLFGFDCDSHLAKDLMVVGMDHVELEMSFPDDCE
jgi:ubiquitin-conjugating enzyme E2 Q